jgi:hypothetical protein
MQDAFTHYWKGDTADEHDELNFSGKPLDHVAGSQFVRMGVKTGDRIYAVTIRRGELYLIGRMEVGEIVFSDSEARKRLDYEPWSGPEHVMWKPGTGTPLRFDRAVPLPVTQRLYFESPNGPVPPKFVDHNVLDRQTLRGVRKLTPSSALELDSLIEADE